jgi:hypothetical protein
MVFKPSAGWVVSVLAAETLEDSEKLIQPPRKTAKTIRAMISDPEKILMLMGDWRSFDFMDCGFLFNRSHRFHAGHL